MKKNKAYRFRIYPNRKQITLLLKTFGCCRFLYNAMLSDKIAAYRETGSMLQTLPSTYKKTYPWLKEVDSLALSNVQLNLQKAYGNFFRKPETGFPRFKSRHHSRMSYTTNVVNGNIRLEGKKIRLPKVGMITIRKHREIPENHRIKSVTLCREPSDKYYVSILTEYEAAENQSASEVTEMNVLGIDFAMHGMAVFSDGTCAEYPGYYRNAQERLAREQRKLSHCRKGSRNWQRQKVKVARCHEKVRNQRKDFHHKLSRTLSDTYDAIAVEDLNLKGMSRGLHFGKSISDNGYGAFLLMMEYKLADAGKKLIKIDRFYPSSKTCSRCGRIKPDLKLSDRTYRCECGLSIDRDVNAAINIREEGKRQLFHNDIQTAV